MTRAQTAAGDSSGCRPARPCRSRETPDGGERPGRGEADAPAPPGRDRRRASVGRQGDGGASRRQAGAARAQLRERRRRMALRDDGAHGAAPPHRAAIGDVQGAGRIRRPRGDGHLAPAASPARISAPGSCATAGPRPHPAAPTATPRRPPSASSAASGDRKARGRRGRQAPWASGGGEPPFQRVADERPGLGDAVERGEGAEARPPLLPDQDLVERLEPLARDARAALRPLLLGVLVALDRAGDVEERVLDRLAVGVGRQLGEPGVERLQRLPARPRPARGTASPASRNHRSSGWRSRPAGRAPGRSAAVTPGA